MRERAPGGKLGPCAPPPARSTPARCAPRPSPRRGGAVAPLGSLTAGTLTWPAEHAHRVLHEWRLWARPRRRASSAPSARIVRAPGRAAGRARLDVAVTRRRPRAAAAARARARHGRRRARGGDRAARAGRAAGYRPITRGVRARARSRAPPSTRSSAPPARSRAASCSWSSWHHRRRLDGRRDRPGPRPRAGRARAQIALERLGPGARRLALSRGSIRGVPAPLILVDPQPRTLDMICDPPTRARLEALGRLVVSDARADAGRAGRRAPARGGRDPRPDRPARGAARARAEGCAR